MDQFIARINGEVHGQTLEIGGRPGNALRYGFRNIGTYRSLDADPMSGADLIADAEEIAAVPENSQDSILIFNVLEHCPRPWIVVDNIHRWLRPGGKVFGMVPNAQRIHRDPKDFWRILPDAFEYMFSSFEASKTYTYGNLLTCIASLSGIAVEEISESDLNDTNPQYPTVTCIVAQKFSNKR